ncbi:MAG TPA: SurA N-terminal domain-containing protein [Nitrospirota bacterium]|nr:SurA N-terminal domain-containing protein [Nitrospirota bacterium]
MICPVCSFENDADALFCVDCGKSLVDQAGGPASKKSMPYFIGVLFAAVIILVAAGYYKFILPDGVAAVVNDEKITLSELDAAVVRMGGARGGAADGLRYRALNELIVERIVLQEAGKAGIRISGDEAVSAARDTRAASGLDDAAFTSQMKALYGSTRDFQKALERRLVINRYLAERIVPRGAGPQAAAQAVDQWLRRLTDEASVRIALTENLSAPCGGCGHGQSGGQPSQTCSRPGRGCQAENSRAESTITSKAAEEAVLRYWHMKHGPDAVSARLQDFGCHIQVEILKDEKIIGSLRYQAGIITEM